MARGSASNDRDFEAPAVLGPGLTVVGRVRGEGDLRVQAQVSGDITVAGVLQLDEMASVTGNVEADALRLSGSLRGDAKVRRAVTINATGRLHGDVTAAELTLEEGASFDGRVDAQFDLPEPLT
jgi:cytoskeletal protein CcmA (bactofilin family)